MILEHSDWEYAGIYADEGISGTTTAERKQFLEMIRLAENGTINSIITKSISRFARNTIDFVTIIRDLKNKGVEVFFEEENLSTLDGTSEFLLTAMASMAEEQAKQVSANCKWSVDKSFREGTYKNIAINTYGYRNKGGKITVVEEEAKS